jgi:hypothetical protein
MPYSAPKVTKRMMRLFLLNLSQYIATRDPVSGAVYLMMLVVFALMPWFVVRSTR